MNKKTILKMAGLLIMGGIAGAGITLGLAAGEDILKGKLLPFMSAKLIAYSLYMMIIVTLAMILPTIMNFTKGKKTFIKDRGIR